MKLRNKKTGEVVDAWPFYDRTQDMNLKYHASTGIVNLKYGTLAELNEDWEDYKSAEPLIKDEKIRKAVRAWASSNEVKEVLFNEYWHSFRDGDMVISFLFSYRDFDCLEDGKTYTIAELCGEEEE
jgi:hypothetical protein